MCFRVPLQMANPSIRVFLPVTMHYIEACCNKSPPPWLKIKQDPNVGNKCVVALK